MIAWRGVVHVDGGIVAWPTLLADHNEVFRVLPTLRAYRCRWRQWEPGGEVDFDRGCSGADREKVESWVARNT